LQEQDPVAGHDFGQKPDCQRSRTKIQFPIRKSSLFLFSIEQKRNGNFVRALASPTAEQLDVVFPYIHVHDRYSLPGRIRGKIDRAAGDKPGFQLKMDL
jgi:hypothetical protein